VAVLLFSGSQPAGDGSLIADQSLSDTHEPTVGASLLAMAA